MKRPVRSRGSAVAMALAIVLLLMVVGTALAVVSTLNLNLAAQEEYSLRAMALARAGLDQFLVDMDSGFIDNLAGPAPVTGVGVVIQQNFVQQVLPNPLAQQRQLALTDPSVPAYPLSAFHGDGQCYITFMPNNARGVGWSTWNANNETPTTGYAHRSVPAFAVDVIATATVGAITRRLAVHAVRRWDFAVAAAQQIFVTTAGGYPTTITGDVYSRSQGTVAGAIHVGYRFDPTVPNYVGAATSGSVVNGRLLDTSPNPASIQVSPGNPVLAQQTNYRLVKFPQFQDVAVDATWKDLTQYTRQNPAPDGSFLLPDRGNATASGTPTYYLENPRGAPMSLADGRFYVNGNLSILGPSQCTGLQLSRAQLKVQGGLILTRRPTTVYGVQSALSVDGDFTFKWGFLQSDQDTGFVISADSLVCQVGGDFHGLVLVRKGIFTSQLNLNDLLGPPLVDDALDVDGVAQPASFPCGRACCCCPHAYLCTICKSGGCPHAEHCVMSCYGCCGHGHQCSPCCSGCSGTPCPHGCCSGGCGSGPGPGPGCGGGPPPCAGTYNLGGTCTGPAFAAPVPNPNPAFVNPATVASIAPPGVVPVSSGTGIAYPLQITGAILSPYGADVTQGYPLIVSSVNVTWDPIYLSALNQHAPISTRSWEMLP